MYGPWQDSIRQLFGIAPGVGSGDRSQSEQQSLIARGVTRASGSEHLIPDHALDAPIRMTSAEAQARLDAAGIPGYALYESGQGPNQGTGPHVHFQRDPFHARATQASSTDWNINHYRTDSGGQSVATNPSEQAGRALLSPATLDALSTASQDEGSLPASLQAAPANPNPMGLSNVGSPVVNPFTQGPELERRAQAMDTEIAGQQAFLNRQDTEMAQLQQERRAHTLEYTTQAQAVNTAVEQANRELLASTNPLLARAQQINDQLVHNATMNPLERGIRGIFDLRYNQGYLERTRDQLHSALADTANRYQFTTTLQDQFLQSLQRGEQLHGVDDALKLTELDETGRLMAQHMAAASASFDTLGREIGANTQLVQAQSLARSTLLDTMDAPQINSLLATAQAHGGQITVQGIPIPSSELHLRAANWDRLNTDLQNAHVSLERNRADLVDANARRMVTHMSEGQLQEAARNGGVFQGVQLPSDAITGALGGFTQRRQIEAANAMEAGGGQTAAQALQGTYRLMEDSRARVRTVGTETNPRFETEQAQTYDEITRLSNQLTTAIHNGTGDSVAPAILQRLQVLRQGFDSRIANMASRYAGGAPITTRVMTAYLRGDPINSDEAAQSMLELVDRGGLPTTMRASPTFRTVYELTERAAHMVDAQDPQHHLDPAERSRMILNMAHNLRLPDQVNEANMTQLFGAVPQIAHSLNHPFARVNPNDFARAMQQGNQDGYTRIAGDLGTDAATIQALDRGNWTPPSGTTAEQAAALRQRFQEVRGQLNVLQQTAFLQHLDESPSATNGFQPSHAYIDLINSNGFLQATHNFEQLQGGYSFGDAVASSMGGGNGLVQTAAGYGAHMRSIQTQRAIEANRASVGAAANYQHIPIIRASAILGAMPELQEADERALLNDIRRHVPNADQPDTGAGVSPILREYIMGTRYRDPNLERIRRVAAAHWDDQAQSIDTAVARMFNPFNYGPEGQ